MPINSVLSAAERRHAAYFSNAAAALIFNVVYYIYANSGIHYTTYINCRREFYLGVKRREIENLTEIN